MHVIGLLLLLASFSSHSSAQNAAPETPKPLDPNDPRLTFTFPIQPGGKPGKFQVQVNKAGEIAGVLVFRVESDIAPLQRFAGCSKNPDQWTTDTPDYDFPELLRHADLNFDGFEDIELVQNFSEHLGKGVYCIYLWDHRAGRYRYAPQVTDEIGVNPEPHPDNRTITTHEDWMGGSLRDSAYQWKREKLELTEQSSLLGDWSVQKDGQCGFTFTCRSLVKGKLVNTLNKSICTTDDMENLPDCPKAPAPHEPKGATGPPLPSPR